MARVLVAMSGGVDSATAALILKHKGHDVAGGILVFEGISEQSVTRAQETARHLDIPFSVFNVRREFQKKIIDRFMAEYRRGRTPNPCVWCNKYIKFDLLFERARAQGRSMIATGHFARIREHNGLFLLKRGVDKNEQSYFLYRLDQKKLSRMIMPLGAYTKGRVRNLAHRYGLPVASSKKSQDICFVPGGGYAALFIKKNIVKKGPIKNMHGEVIGEHSGTVFYTIGQRRGIGVSGRSPYYVTRIDAKSNTLYVGSRDDCYASSLYARDIHYIVPESVRSSRMVQAKVRYVSRLSRAVITPITEHGVKVTFRRRQWAPTPGQSVVFYDHDRVLGGGIIEDPYQYSGKVH
ncbi:MAG: tRNA 2-thiouridine(34) synthase MnmA [candidate division WOR-3 bacterium]|nr:MAG: tRNA 2-thiouridine(34) synthase MnmA [candidate division WOR-3 bacterium]